MKKAVPFVFLEKNKPMKEKLFALVLKKKSKKKEKKSTRKKTNDSKGRKGHGFQTFQKPKKVWKGREKKSLFFPKESTKKKEEGLSFFLKEKLLWVKKKLYSCFFHKGFRFLFKRFRNYRFLYYTYTMGGLYAFLSLGRAALGTLLRLATFPIKPMHFEFCYRRCEGVLLCSPQKWYTLSLLNPTYF